MPSTVFLSNDDLATLDGLRQNGEARAQVIRKLLRTASGAGNGTQGRPGPVVLPDNYSSGIPGALRGPQDDYRLDKWITDKFVSALVIGTTMSHLFAPPDYMDLWRGFLKNGGTLSVLLQGPEVTEADDGASQVQVGLGRDFPDLVKKKRERAFGALRKIAEAGKSGQLQVRTSGAMPLAFSAIVLQDRDGNGEAQIQPYIFYPGARLPRTIIPLSGDTASCALLSELNALWDRAEPVDGFQLPVVPNDLPVDRKQPE